MLFRSINNWSNLVQLKGLLFFAQRLEELTFDYSLDSYKAPTTNGPYLVREVLDQLQSQRNRKDERHNCQPIIEEMKERLFGNQIVSNIISIDLARYLKFDENSIEDIISKLSVLRRELDPRVYCLETMRFLKLAVSASGKADIDFASRELVTTLVNMGMSTNHIHRQCIEYFFNENRKIESVDQLDEFYKIVFPHLHRFVIAFKIDSKIEFLEKENIEMFKMEISDTLPDVLVAFANQSGFSHLGDDQRFLIFDNILAFDAHSAMSKAEEKIGRLHDLFRIFHHKQSFTWGKEAIASQCCVDGVRRIGRGANRMQFVNDFRPAKASQKLHELMSGINLPRGEDREKFFRLVDFHGMSVATDVTENQLLNLWISLETITPPNPNVTKIENVVHGVSPFIGLSYIKRIFERLSFDLVKWDRHETGKIVNQIGLKGRATLPEKIAILLLDKEKEPLLSELLAKVGDFELLKFRLFALNKAMSNPAKTLEALKSHQRRVRWQIRRIYRTRNSIVHSGDTPEYTGMLVENAHEYFDQVFLLVCSLCSNENGFYTFKECFDYAAWQYDQYIDNMSKLESFNSENIRKLLWRRPKIINRKELI